MSHTVRLVIACSIVGCTPTTRESPAPLPAVALVAEATPSPPAAPVAVAPASTPPPPSTPLDDEAAADDTPAWLPGELPPGDSGPPRLRLRPHDRASDGCDHALEVLGFPAVRSDGSQYAVVFEASSAGGDEAPPIQVEIHGRDESAIETVLVSDGEAIAAATGDAWNQACRRERAAIEARIVALNARFASDWRPMRRLAVQWPWHVEGAPQMPQYPFGRTRPVEAIYHGGHFIARVRGRKVLQSTPMPKWRGEDPEMTLDASTPTIVALYHDADAGLSLAGLSYESASCMSDTSISLRVVALAPEVIAEADARAGWLIADPDPPVSYAGE